MNYFLLALWRKIAIRKRKSLPFTTTLRKQRGRWQPPDTTVQRGLKLTPAPYLLFWPDVKHLTACAFDKSSLPYPFGSSCVTSGYFEGEQRNCHLVVIWIPGTIEGKLEEANTDNTETLNGNFTGIKDMSAYIKWIHFVVYLSRISFIYIPLNWKNGNL